MPPAASATNRIRLSGDVDLAEHQQEGDEAADAPDHASSRLFHIRRSELRISIASMAMTANSGRQCCS